MSETALLRSIAELCMGLCAKAEGIHCGTSHHTTGQVFIA
jgi:hypothetical protein